MIFLFSCDVNLPGLPSSKNQTKFPRLISNSQGEILLSWFEEIEPDKWALMSSIFSNKVWSSPNVITKNKEYFINWADFPSTNYINNDTLVAHWLEKSGPGTYDYDVHLSFSFNRGADWTSSQIPHATLIKGEHGFVSFGIGKSMHDVVWLDGRNMIMDHSKEDYGQMSLYHSSFTSNGNLINEYEIDDRVCECCPTSSVRVKDTLIVAYRNRSLDEIRDIYIARRVGDTWEKSYPVHNDGWSIAGCPVNGPMLSANNSNVALAWYTSANGNPSVKVAFSTNSGKNFSTPQRVDLSMPIGRVDIEWISNSEILISWIEDGDDSSNILARRISLDNNLSNETLIEKIPPGRVTGYPQMEVFNENVLFAWTENKKTSAIKSKWLPISDIGK